MDDDHAILRALEKSLTGEGYVVRTRDVPFGATNECVSFRPDVVLVDVNMPGLGGLELARVIQEETEGEVGIILFSGKDPKGLEQCVRDKGFLGAIDKGKDLLPNLERLLSEWKRQQGELA